MAAASTGDQRLATKQSHDQSHNQFSQSAIEKEQLAIKVEGCRLSIGRGKSSRRIEARNDAVRLQHLLESLTSELGKTFTQVAILVQRATVAGEEPEQLKGLSRISAMQKRASDIRALCEQSPEYEVTSRGMRGDVLLQLYTIADGSWQAAAEEASRAAEGNQQGSATNAEQEPMTEQLTVRTVGENVVDLWFEECR